MAGSDRVQRYLQKHRIGPLFEDLMAKIINDMPDDPCLYLSRILNLRSERSESKVSQKKPGEFDSAAKKSYDKPWQTNSKRLTKDVTSHSKTVTATKKTSAPKAEWDHRTKVIRDSSNFEDLWEDSRTAKNQCSGSPEKHNSSQLRDTQDGEDVMISTYGYRGPHKSRKMQDDPLNGEFTLMKSPTETKTNTTHTAKPGKKGSRSMSLAAHKASLEQYVQAAESRTDSGYEEDPDNNQDTAIELLEDEEDLRREGVLNVNKSGVRLSRTARRQGSVQSNVRVSICATCARVMTGGKPSEALSAKHAGRFDEDYDTVTTKNSTRLNKAHFSAVPSDDDDEEFESVSQVTGPRRPVWQDSDQEPTPRKGKSMLSSNLSPIKGLPMYSTNKGVDSLKKGNHGNKKTSQSDEFFQVAPDRGVVSDPVRRTWTVNTEDYSEDEVSGLENASSGWQLPPDYDTDSSFYGSPGAQTQRADRAY